jgi:hypothetical protein
MMMMKVYSARLSLKGTSTIYMGSIPPVPPWSRDSPYVYFEWFSAFNSTFRRPLLGRISDEDLILLPASPNTGAHPVKGSGVQSEANEGVRCMDRIS